MPTENLDSLAKVPPSHKVDIVFKRCFNDHFRYFLLKVCVYVMTVLKHQSLRYSPQFTPKNRIVMMR